MRSFQNPWLALGILALGFSGLYSIVVVLLRAPIISQILDPNLFKSSLVVHVNLSVLIWLLSIACCIWEASVQKFAEYSHIKFTSIILSLIASVMIAISPLIGSPSPIMNNYVPMLDNSIVFVIGLSIFGVSILIYSVLGVVDGVKKVLSGKFVEILDYGSLCSCIMFLAVWLCFVLSYFGLEYAKQSIELDIEYYYELLFWSGGHLLQFIYTQTLLVVWFYSVKFNNYYKKVFITLLLTNFIFGMIAISGHIFYDIIDGDFKEVYTIHMRYFGGLAPSCAIMFAMYVFYKNKDYCSNVFVGFSCSSILFIFGGIIGLMISGTNVRIPAHYHGQIVGLSIAFMSFAYYVYNIKSKWSIYQMYVVTFGQIMHISGLAYAGGYGVLRKTPGLEIALSAKIAMGVMGIGGLIAIIGGLMFVVICAKPAFNTMTQILYGE